MDADGGLAVKSACYSNREPKFSCLTSHPWLRTIIPGTDLL